MKSILRRLFSFVLNVFEKGTHDYDYRPSHRKILIAVGALLGAMCGFILILTKGAEGYGYLIPVVTFGAVSMVTLIVGCLGTDEAVANIWNSKR